MAEARQRLPTIMLAAGMMTLTFTSMASATCSGTDCAAEVLGVANQIVGFAGNELAHPGQGWRDCPGVAFCSPHDPIFGTPDCAVADVPLACPYAHERSFVGDGIEWINQFPAAITPRSSDQLVLVGQGHESVKLNGNTHDCAGDSLAVLEASRKPLGFEPGITFGFAGASARLASAALACFEGERVQPGYGDLQAGSQYPDGAWSAVKRGAGHTWSVSVGAPSPDGSRAVDYVYSSPDGVQGATFHGTLLEWR